MGDILLEKIRNKSKQFAQNVAIDVQSEFGNSFSAETVLWVLHDFNDF